MEDHEEDETLELGSRTWNRVMEPVSKTGYREGIDEGSQEVLQSDFDVGYEDGFKAAFILGKYKALAAQNRQKNCPEIEKILQVTRRGECYICKLESSGEVNQFDSPAIIKAHKDHVTKTIHKLNEYFSPPLAEKNVNIEQLTLP